MFIFFFIIPLLSKEILAVEEFFCENTNLNIECPTNTILHIDNAIYGRHNSTICPKKDLDKNTNCSSENATQILQQRCDGKDNCTFLVSNDIFTDPCVGTYKYLELNYSCEPILRFPPLLPPRPFICGPNEVLGCKNLCLRPYLPCPAICIRTCVCKSGYVKDIKTGRCISRPLQGPNCKTHEVFSECGGGCEKTCANQNPICTLQCVPGFICAKNYVRDPTTKRCVHPADCPVISSNNTNNCNGSNEDYRCVNHCYREFCNPPISYRGCRRTPFCEDRCVCETEYLRDPKTGRCINEQYCPLPGLQSDTHEVFSECGAGCQPTCTNRNPVCNRLCVAGYVCANGYIRNSTRQCIRPNQCPT